MPNNHLLKEKDSVTLIRKTREYVTNLGSMKVSKRLQVKIPLELQRKNFIETLDKMTATNCTETQMHAELLKEQYLLAKVVDEVAENLREEYPKLGGYSERTYYRKQAAALLEFAEFDTSLHFDNLVV